MALWSKPAAARAATTTTATTARGSLWRQWWWLLSVPVARALKRMLLRIMALWLNNPLRRLRIGNRAAAPPQLADDRDVDAVYFASNGDASTAAATTTTEARGSHASAAVGGAVGLVNTGNTCFVNATLQCLAVLPAFQASIAEAIDTLQQTQHECDAKQQQRLHAATALLSLLQLLAPVDSPACTDRNSVHESDENAADEDNDSDAKSTSSDAADAREQRTTHERAARKRRRCESESQRSSSRTPTTARCAVRDRETVSAHVRAFLDATRVCTDLLAARGAAQEQQDAEEFLSFLLELLHELVRPVRSRTALDAREVAYYREGEAFYARELAKCHPLEPRTYTDAVSGLGDLRWQRFLTHSDSVVTDLFVGQIVRGSQCCSCAALTCLHQELRVLSLSVSTSASSQSLASCLAAHRHAEHLVDDNRVFCEGHCHMKTSRVTQVLFQRAPPVLVVQLQRFKQSAWGQSLEKIRTAVAFPSGSRHGDASALLDLTDNMFVRSDAQRVQYELVGVCAHVGASIDSGHYVAYVRQRGAPAATTSASRWLRLDDDVVTELDDARFRDETLASAYMLFYAQVTTD